MNIIQTKCKLEKHGYRHNRIVYGFSVDALDITELQSLGLNVEEIAFDEEQRNLVRYLIERGRALSKIDHLRHDREQGGADNAQEEADVQQKLTDLSSKVQAAKETLGIVGTIKLLKF
ncbi:hypothetical protein V5T82_13680 [Magnetovibrio sp. PR-2]|uniref:hypothetical protein n=1 Tax=Magnetovibrio sp. PR-2 TaxID=3120356 RepID=UPI002FCE5E93